MIQYDRTKLLHYMETPEARTYTMLGLTLIAVIICLVFAIQPGISDILSTKAQIDEDQSTIQALDANIKAIADLKVLDQQYIEPNKTLLAEILPSNSSVAPIFANIYAIAGKDNISLGELAFSDGSSLTPQTNPGSITPPTGIGQVVVKINGISSEENILQFIKDLENYPRIINIYDVNIGDDQNISQDTFTTKPVFDGKYSFNLNVQLFYLLQP